VVACLLSDHLCWAQPWFGDSSGEAFAEGKELSMPLELHSGCDT
jgi:hypothetical protein